MSILTLVGLIAVSTMLVAYALEDRSPAFILLFAAACAASSAYGFLAGTWPFGIVEAVWTTVALRRWLVGPNRHVDGYSSERLNDNRGNRSQELCHIPAETLGKHRHLRGDADAHRCCGKSLMGTALAGFGVPQHARAESISKRAPSTTRTSLRVFRISSLQASG